MTTFLVNCEVEAHVSLADGNPVLRYSHPRGLYKVSLRNLHVEPGADRPLLSLQMTFEAPSLGEAKDIAEPHVKEFLDYLTFVTSGRFRLYRTVQVFNWEPGDAMREAIYYAGFANPDVPLAELNDIILDTVALMQRREVQPRIRRALKWFGSAVAARYLDDRFTYFWFVIEILAQVVKDVAPVPDKCPQCHGPLYCPACGVSHLHRPYPKQAIEQLFAKHVKGNWELLYEHATDARNRLLHGEEVSAIEEAIKIDFSKLLDAMGHLAWTVIVNQFVADYEGSRVRFLRPERYVDMHLTVGTHVQFGFVPDFENPDPGQFPALNITMITHHATDGDDKKEIEHYPIGS